jgi:hypothetical protein
MTLLKECRVVRLISQHINGSVYSVHSISQSACVHARLSHTSSRTYLIVCLDLISPTVCGFSVLECPLFTLSNWPSSYPNGCIPASFECTFTSTSYAVVLGLAFETTNAPDIWPKRDSLWEPHNHHHHIFLRFYSLRNPLITTHLSAAHNTLSFVITHIPRHTPSTYQRCGSWQRQETSN